MANRQDILLVNNSLAITDDGDFIMGDSDEQHIQDTVNAFPGWWKENPSDGVGALQYLNAAGNTQALSRAIKIQLQSDGYSVNNPQIQFENGKQLIINPNATAI